MKRDAIDEGYKSLTTEFNKVTKLKKLLEQDKEKKQKEKKDNPEEDGEEDDDKAEEYINTFYDHASKTFKLIDEQITKIDKDYEDVCKFLGESSKSFSLKDHFIPLFIQLNDQIMEGLRKYKEIKEKKEKAEKKRRKEEEKAAKKAKMAKK